MSARGTLGRQSGTRRGASAVRHSFDDQGAQFDPSDRLGNWWTPADLAGLVIAYDAFRLALTGGPASNVAGLTPEQQFFVAYSQSWREKVREPALRQQLLTDGHAPARYRADAVRNLDPWYAAFDVVPGQALYLPGSQRVRLW